MFKILKKSKISSARLGIIKTPHGVINTPCFMPDATRGVVKQLSSDELSGLGLEALVANTLHLFLRPGVKFMKRAGGLHQFMAWPRPILTDSGGYQVFSLIHRGKQGGAINDKGAFFKSPLDGSKIGLTPEQSIKIQLALGSDLIVCLDDCPPNDYDDEKIGVSVERTIKWAKRCKKEYDKHAKRSKILLFAVVQGGNNLKLRELCARELIKIGFDGYGFGARHIDAQGNFLGKTLAQTAGLLPDDKPRFGLGIGSPEDILKAVKLGWDMFDCVIPTREGRHGRLFLSKKSLLKYAAVNITNAKYAKDFSPINAQSKLVELRQYSKAYLNYLFKIGEPLAARLASLNNLEFYLTMLTSVRGLIKNNKF